MNTCEFKKSLQDDHEFGTSKVGSKVPQTDFFDFKNAFQTKNQNQLNQQEFDIFIEDVLSGIIAKIDKEERDLTFLSDQNLENCIQ